MKKLILSLSLLTAFSTSAFAVENQSPVSDNHTVSDCTSNKIIVLEETDDCFDFNTASYLPEGFNAYAGMFNEVTVAEADEAFDFDTKDYLPAGFNPIKEKLISNEL